jgi:hypothetical protein
MLNLIAFNRWWDSCQVEKIYLKPYKRALFFTLEKFLDTRQIILIYGLRRVGKTTLLYQLIDSLLKKGIDKKDILYFSFDEKAASLKEVFKNYSELALGEDILKRKKIYVFLDEVQKLEDWQNQLKVFYDLYPNVKFIVSGSASLIISKGAKESLAGRVYELLLPLLDFSEYLEMLGEKVRIDNIFDFESLRKTYLKKERLSPLFFSYLKKGGFIEIIKEEDDLKIKEYSKSILERVIFGDIVMTFGVKQPQVLKSILEITASNPGFLLDYSKLARIFNRDQRVIADYVEYLKYSLLVKTLYNFSGSRFISERKLKKIYLASTNFIYQFYSEKFKDPGFSGKIVENLIASFDDNQFFWRERQNEVDLVLKNNIPLEIKYKANLTKEDLKGISKFIEKFGPKKAIVLTKDELKIDIINKTQIYFIPAWMYMLAKKN